MLNFNSPLLAVGMDQISDSIQQSAWLRRRSEPDFPITRSIAAGIGKPIALLFHFGFGYSGGGTIRGIYK
jgi:hypothetical protein